MGKFLKKSLTFILIGVISIEASLALFYFSNLYLVNYPGKEIYHSIHKSKKRNKSKILLLGDSVGNQLFSNKINNDSTNSLACNQSIGMVGQYLLLNNYLKAGNSPEKVFMIMNPFTFENNLDQIFTYHYFLKPFNKSEYYPLFSNNVKEQITKIPYNQFSQVPHILVGTWAPEYTTKDQRNFSFLSPISKEYLLKIKSLSVDHNFKLVILPTPVDIDKKYLIEKMDINEVKECNLEMEFRDYFNDIIYLDNTNFSDGTHLIYPEVYTEIYKRDLMKESIDSKTISQ